VFANYLNIILRNINKNKIYSIINICSLAIGLASGMLVLLFVEQQLSFDEFHEKSDRIYRVITDAKDWKYKYTLSDISPVWGTILKQELPEIVEVTRICHVESLYGEFIIEHENKYFSEQNPLFVDANIFNVFDIELKSGNPETALKEPRSIVLSEEMAKKYYPDEDPVGKTMSLNMWIMFVSENPDGFDPSGDYLITGVAKNLPPNSHFHFDCLLSFSSLKFWRKDNGDLFAITFGANTYLVLPEGYPYEELESKIPGLVKTYQSASLEQRFGIPYDDFPANDMYFRYRLQKISDIHHGSGNMRSIKKLGPGGDVKDIYFFTLIALAIILIASINFININTAQLGNRAREVGLRKVLGSNRSQLIRQFLLETIIISFCALLIAILVAILALKAFNQFIQPDLSVQNFIHGWVIPGILGLTIIVGLLSGIYPAIVFSRLQPAAMLKNSMQTASGGSLFRNVLVIFQFSISVIFIVSALVVYNQLSFIRNKPLGFNKEHVITIHNAHRLNTEGPINGVHRLAIFMQELSRNSNILSVSGSSDKLGFLRKSNPYKDNFVLEGRSEEEKVRLCLANADRNIFETFDLNVVALDENIANIPGELIGPAVLNEAAVKYLNLTDPIGKTITREFGQHTYIIAGVVKDFHFESLHQTIQPYILFLQNDWGIRPFISINSVYIRINPVDVQGTLDYIEKVSEQFMPGQPFEYSFLDEDIDRFYKSEKQLGKLFNLLSGIAIILSYLGIFGLSSYMLFKRTKEIAIRKILGASIKDIVQLLSRQFLILAIIAFILAIPVSYILMDNWLHDFAYRIKINPLTFVFAILIILFILAIAVGRQTFKSAISNPVDAVKYE